MDAQASSSRPVASASERTTQAADKFSSGLKSFKAGHLDEAVQSLGEALELRIDLHGDTSVECASSYHHYGAALFAKAQEESDVFGTSIRETAASPSKAADLDKENRKGKGKAVEPAATDGSEDDEDSDAEDDGNDMQLAWEMLELAKLCYSSDVTMHKQQLADVHILLGDIGMEQEAFDGALADYSQSIQLLVQEKGIERKMAELHYKTALALQFLDEPEKALEHTNIAISHCQSQQQGAQASSDTTSSPVNDEAQGDDLKGILVDLQAKADDLKEAIQQRTSTKNAMKAAFMQLAGSLDPLSQASAGASSSQTSTAIGTAPKPADGAVRDLGVVGRGNKRIKLAPAPLSGSDGSKPLPLAMPSVSVPSSQPSRLDQLMNSSSTTVGFGASKPAQTPLAVREDAAHANGAQGQSQLPPSDMGAKAADKVVCKSTASQQGSVT